MLSCGKLIKLFLMTFGASGLGGHPDQINIFLFIVIRAMTEGTGYIIFAMFTDLPVLDKQRSNPLVAFDTSLPLRP